MAPCDVKQSDRVVYAIGKKEYDAVALNAPTLSFHSGFKRASHHLNLRYLNDDGTPITIYGAALLTVATSEKDRHNYAQMNACATHIPAPGGHPPLQAFERVEVPDHECEDALAELEANPITTGWRPVEVKTTEADEETAAAAAQKAEDDAKASADKSADEAV